MKNRNSNNVLGKPFFITLVIAVAITGTLMVVSLSRTGGNTTTSFLCTFAGFRPQADPSDTTPSQFLAILHYATSRVVPQQTASEIRVTFDVLQLLYPCNFLIFGLGHDSLMWSSFNPRGTTLFLEEDIKWVHRILTNGPSLRVLPVHYNTRLSDADQLMKTYKSKQHCVPPDVYLKGNTRCKLALSDMPDEVYNKQWDVILIDGPRGYFQETPGRMASIFTAAVMARTRVRPGVTHVILHDVDRKVEKEFAMEFLCAKYRVKAVDRLWHFEIPPASKWSTGKLTTAFC
ncbi:arabinogalactan O-methyltransferase 1-like [Cornus florida]|uniref:arabinogalactan O-methyltransferase 1-like n=1 Tax=Cornus florida TaxID=4283 RepID=UPI00289A9511|nr:arabinogalactan O-methyltransferase 1-like [Cornus florida]